jgi:hypothetical protein
MFRPPRWLELLVATAVTASSCAGCIERLAPQEVAAGVARMTVRNAGYYAKLALNDTRCGFASPTVKRAAVVMGQPGSPGAVITTIKDCVIEMPRTELAADCVGDVPIVEGKLTVSGRQHIVGTVTGDSQTPVIPDGADSVRLELTVVPQGFTIKKSRSVSWLTNVSGTLNFVLAPRIALSRSLGVCAVQTLDGTFSQLTYTDAQVVVTQGDRTFPVDVPAANLVAQTGKWQSQENSFSGTVTVWDTSVTLPLPGDPEGLDPDYTPQAYFESVACDPDLVLPVSYACPSLKERLAHGVARLSVKQLGAMASLVQADTRCGFSSPQVLNNAVLRGSVGGPGSATFTLSAPCTFSYPTKTVISTDCTGLEAFAQGTVSISGTMTLTGVLTGDVVQPVAPDTRDPAVLALSATFSDLTLSDSRGGQALRTKHGTLSGTVRPQVALDTRSDICSNTTSIASMTEVSWRDAMLGVNVDGFDFDVDVSQAALTAQSGSTETASNSLTGTVVSDGQPITIPPGGVPPVLDPTYDEQAFVAGFSCAAGFRLASSDGDCSLNKALASNAARLTVQAAGALASMIQADTTCGFSALQVKVAPTSVSGEMGQQGAIGWDVQGCRLGSAGTFPRGVDCLGNRAFVGGIATLDAHRVVTGERNAAYVVFDSIIPRASDAMTITLRKAVLSEFTTFTVAPGATTPYAKLIIHRGTLTGTVQPALGERTSTPGIFDVGTPVARFTEVTLSNATATLWVENKRFELTLPALTVSALNGTLGGVSNTISGSVVLGSNILVTVPPSPLDPSFTQASFDQAYACTPDLKAPIPR